MALPELVLHPPFNCTRASHVVLTARDLGATRAFYEGALGFVVSDETRDALYLRGLEERSHHSVVFQRSSGPAEVRRIGLRVQTEDDLDKAAAWFAAEGRPTAIVEAPHQSRTLHTSDAAGVPLELCATMTDLPTLLQKFHLYKGGSPMRLDHFQIAVPDVQAITDFYARLGFRLSEYTAADGTDELWGAWLERKGNPHDIVFSNGRGPRMHHFAFAVPETRDIVHACDVAASLGFRDTMERGPGRHGIGNALFAYFRDPDGYRLELFNAHYQIIDINHPPLRWELSDTSRSQLWGLPATSKWFFEASVFAGVAVRDPDLRADPVTLERFLASQ